MPENRERCVRCTAANCYTRKQGAFVPVFAKKGGTLGDKIYLYRRSAPDKSLFAEVKDLVSDREAAVIYVLQLLNVLL